MDPLFQNGDKLKIFEIISCNYLLINFGMTGDINDLIHLNLDPFAPIGSNGQYLPLKPITI